MVADTTRCPAAVSVSTACHVCLAGARREGKDEDEQVCASCPATPARPRGISERGGGTGAHRQSRRAMADLRGAVELGNCLESIDYWNSDAVCYGVGMPATLTLVLWPGWLDFTDMWVGMVTTHLPQCRLGGRPRSPRVAS
jgi:hypothetical protein